MCHSILGNFSKASVFFAASSCLEPHSLKSYYQLSKSMMESESVEEAFEICKGAIPHFPKDSIKALPNLLEKISIARNAAALRTEAYLYPEKPT